MNAAMEQLRRGVVIPACPLVLDAERRLDEARQRALLRYYAAAGAGGVAVGVHTTQFEIREASEDLFGRLLRLASATLYEASQKRGQPLVKVAGICGTTPQALREAEGAVAFGYDLGLLSLGAFRAAADDELLAHCAEVGRVIPLMGFYLQPAVGGRVLPFSFWRRFAEIPSLCAIKIAPFNRYQTLDVVRAVGQSGRADEITLYTGNDDNIVADLLTPFPVMVEGRERILRIRGGLLGQWAVWTRCAVELLEEIHDIVDNDRQVPAGLLRIGAALTDANAAIFDAANGFAGCIPGIHEVLCRQGLMKHVHCLDPALGLSPGQREEIDRVCREYPWLTDDEFVRDGTPGWLRE